MYFSHQDFKIQMYKISLIFWIYPVRLNYTIQIYIFQILQFKRDVTFYM